MIGSVHIGVLRIRWRCPLRTGLEGLEPQRSRRNTVRSQISRARSHSTPEVAVPRDFSSHKALPEQRSDCPIARSLDVLGDRWTLLIVRDLFRGKKRFSDFLASAEVIKTNILTDRLKRLESAGLIQRLPYQKHPPRYDYYLTSPGRDLSPILTAIFAWGRAHFPDLRP